jgi:ATP-dependent Lon protease
MDKDFEKFIDFLNKKRKSSNDIDEQNLSMLNDFKYISTQRLLTLGDDILKLKGDKLIDYTIDLIKNFKSIIHNTKNKKGNNLLDKSSSLILTIELSVSCIILKDIKKLVEQDKKLTFKKCIKLFEKECQENNKKQKLEEIDDVSEEETEETNEENEVETESDEFMKEVFKNNNDDEKEILDFYDNLTPKQKQETLNKIKEINNYLNEDKPIIFRIMELPLPTSQKNYIIRQYATLNNSSHSETKLQTWFDSLMTIPFNKYTGLDINNLKNVNGFLEDLKNKMNDAVYGHNEAKHQIIQIMAQQIRNPLSKGNVIGLYGPPGNGKTSLLKEGVSKALGKPFVFISLGGATDASYLDGHSYTYEGSICGRIVSSLISCKCMDPVLYFDELDKISKTHKGDEITNLLIHLTDPVQNSHFHDKYFQGIDIDLSRTTIIFSFNDPDNVNPILLDRITTIETKYLLTEEKIHIGQKYLIPFILKEVGLKPDDVIISDELMKYIISKYTYEGGVRKLKSLLFLIIREINLHNLLKTKVNNKLYKLPFTVTINHLKEILKDKYEMDETLINKEDKCGVINGLYANCLGIGGILPIELLWIPSNEPLSLKTTGYLEKVIKESTDVACSLAWNSLTEELRNKYRMEWKKKPMGIHIHCPEGSVPKDGPSAGAALTLAI